MNSVKVTCISENTIAFRHSLLASHGQSLLVEVDDKKYLFDTSEIYEGFMYNMENLHLRFADIHSVILSHNHLDHSGALFKLIDKFTEQKLFLPPDMLTLEEKKYSPGYRIESREAGIQKLLDYKNTKIITDGIQLDKNIYTTGALEADVKEQSLVLDIPNKGLVVLVGCAHPTLPVIIDNAKQVTGKDKIYGIVGGLHYAKLTDDELIKNVTYMQSLNASFIVPSHCTGYKATVMMQKILGEKVHVSTVGGQFGSGNSFTILPDLTFTLT
jgi:7,8-dihydropterin-6-yl-methyl-4-(beta-D-ribofuranosyl)aminobenzene 5'-phosphate synthase